MGISREEAIRMLKSKMDGHTDTSYEWAETVRMAIEALEQEPKVGEWLEKEVNNDKIEEWQSARCSVCDRYHTTPYMYFFSHYDYCPHCGSKMEVEET